LKAIRTNPPDLIVLDLMLPGIDGMELCKILKNDPHTRHIPILMLTAKSEESDVVVGLEVGADDYITKPFSPKVLMARIKTAIRRKTEASSDDSAVITIHNLVIDPGRHQVLINGRPVDLTRTEFQLLHFLARRTGLVFSRFDIINGVKGEDAIVTDRTVDVQIAGLRKKLGAAGQLIETVRGVGYRFKEP
jgi:two-component system alkaline phosphatase synthesis response regulator PhoP